MSAKICMTSMIEVLTENYTHSNGDAVTCHECGLPYLKGEEVLDTHWFDYDGFVSDGCMTHKRCASESLLASVTTDETRFRGRTWTQEDENDRIREDADRREWELERDHKKWVADLVRACAGCFLAHCGGCPSEPASV